MDEVISLSRFPDTDLKGQKVRLKPVGRYPNTVTIEMPKRAYSPSFGGLSFDL